MGITVQHKCIFLLVSSMVSRFWNYLLKLCMKQYHLLYILNTSIPIGCLSKIANQFGLMLNIFDQEHFLSEIWTCKSWYNSGEIGEAKFKKVVAWKANVAQKWREGKKHWENKDYSEGRDCKLTIYIIFTVEKTL